MARSRETRVYARMQGGVKRYYLDARAFEDVGGKREALIPSGAESATTDARLAQALAAERLSDLEARRRRKQRGEPLEEACLPDYAASHLAKKARSPNITTQWLASVETHLLTAIEFFCNRGRPAPHKSDGSPNLDGVSVRELGSIGVEDVSNYVAWLANRPNGRGGTLSPSSQRKYLNSLSNLYRRAISEKRIAVGHNPVSALMDKPQDATGRPEADWLEVPDAALFLEAARLHKAKRDFAMAHLHPLLATFLLTGGRPAEVLGLRVADVSFDREIVTFRPNRWRRLKTKTSHRTVPLWPQLAGILREYLSSEIAPPSDGLLFPSIKSPGMIRDLRKPIDQIAATAGWRVGEIRPYAFRHTYCAARLQTLDNDHPVSPYTVATELGHGGDGLVKRIYGHLGVTRHRSEHVEYRVEQFAEYLGARLRTLRGLP